MEPLVSAIIPTYNRQHFLREAIESVLQQDYSHYELIIVDDGSTDATRDLVAAYPVAQYLHQKNQGVSAARNRGIAHARGSLITFLDSDDLWL
nr:glycosyltransferase family 2 protein [Deltaproteobacteria bacterium]